MQLSQQIRFLFYVFHKEGSPSLAQRQKSLYNFIHSNQEKDVETMVSLMTHLRSSLEGLLDQASEDSADYRIAHYLLGNCYVVNNISIQDVARNCFVSKSTVSRFCRQIGYHDYQELNQAIYQAFLRSNHIKFQEYMTRPDGNQLYLDEVQECLDIVREAAKPAVIGEVVLDLMTHKRVGLLGKMQSNSVAIDLQHDLLVSHKVASAPMMPENQLAFIENSGSDTFLLVISCSGTYFRGFLTSGTFDPARRPKVTLLTNNAKMIGDPAYDRVIVIPCTDTYAKHPLALKLFCNLIAVNYAKAVFTKGSAAESPSSK